MNEVADVGWDGLGGYGCVVKFRAYFWKEGVVTNGGGNIINGG